MSARDDEALAKLRHDMEDGKSYYEAVTALKRSGYSQLEINNATTAYNKGSDKVDDDQAKADIIADAATKVAKRQLQDKETETEYRYVGTPGFGFSFGIWGFSVRVGWWELILTAAIPLIFLFLLVKGYV